MPNVTVNLIAPGTLYGDRINQLDFRVAKILRFGRTRPMVGVDLYNALNSSAVLTYNNAFVPNGTWLQPVTVLTGRLIKFSGGDQLLVPLLSSGCWFFQQPASAFGRDLHLRRSRSRGQELPSNHVPTPGAAEFSARFGSMEDTCLDAHCEAC